MTLNLQDKTILVTGASSGIGRGLCQRLDNLGARLVLCFRNASGTDELIGELTRKDHVILSADMLHLESIETAAEKLKATGIQLNGCVFAAGSHMLRPLKMMKPEHWHSAFTVNTIAPSHFLKALVQGRMLSNSASIVFISSIAGLKAEPGASAYSGAKGALISLTRSFAGELATQGIRVNCVSPGVVDTRMSQAMFEKLPPTELAELRKRHLLGIGSVSDISEPIAFLLSEMSRWITGQNIVVDGGYSIT